MKNVVVMLRLTKIGFPLLAFMLVFAAIPACANFVNNTNTDISGQGFGNIYVLLSMNHTDPLTPSTEIGAVAPTNASNLGLLGSTGFGPCTVHSGIDLCGNANNQSEVLTAATLTTLGITGSSTFGLLYNVNQQGSNLNTYLNAPTPFTVYFYSSGGTIVFSASYLGTTTAFPPIDNGQGGAGYLFTLDAAEGATFNGVFSQIANIGMSGTIGNANDGADNFSIVNATNPTPIPEPATFGLIGTGLLVLGGLFRRRPRNRG